MGYFLCLACARIMLMNIVVGIIIGVFMLMLLVIGHEFGHFLMASKNGVEVEEFGIGFPPRIICWRRVDGKWRVLKRSEWEKMPGKGIVLSVNLLPIGGFCQMKGENAADKRKGTFGAARFLNKTKILFGGVLANWLIAIVVFTVLALAGMPQFLDNQFKVDSDSRIVVLQPVEIVSVESDSPAAKAGLKEGDVIEELRVICEDVCERRTVKVNEVKDLLSFDTENAGKEIMISYKRDGNNMLSTVKLNSIDDEYLLGAGISGNAVYRSTWSAPIVGVGTTLQITGETFKGIGELVVKLVSGAIQSISPNETTRESGAEALTEAKDSVSGPVGIIGMLFPAFAQSGVRNTMFLVGLISVSLACMNVLPIPALDGGRWLLILVFKLRKAELTKELEEKIVGRAFAVILILALLITVLDIVRIVK